MAIEVAGKRFVTLADEFFVNGSKVYEAYVNGVKVYPEDESLEYWVTGESIAHYQCQRNRETWIMPDWWPAEGDENYTYRFESNLPIYTFTHTDSTYGYTQEIALVSLYDTVRGIDVRARNNSVVVRTSCSGTFKEAPYGDYIDGMWGAAPDAEWLEFERNDDLLEETGRKVDFSRKGNNNHNVLWKPGLYLQRFTELGTIEVDGGQYSAYALVQYGSYASCANTQENGRHLDQYGVQRDYPNWRSLGATFTSEEEVYNNRGEDNEVIMCRFASAATMESTSNYSSIQEWAEDWLEKINALP